MNWPSAEYVGIESSPLLVSCFASAPVWIQMFPALAYTMEPGNTVFGTVTITFDGAADGGGPPAVPSPPVPPSPVAAVGRNGIWPLNRFRVNSAMTTRATIP